ncbi:DNA-binding domain-containing protein [Gimibacter soli]|uniref:DNA-binding domain-containing protein n=1 Tax=Gimibacter soli TaxID=3024400 RepID=A0AAE9XQG6_9PROT|nr:DNA-binding domain-containing protein [Gimibacter soli]WCL54352.1 DNA-binding domain-containing protein [Gimibacter soli]
MNRVFAQAVLAPAADVPLGIINTGGRFNLYRNNFLAGLTDILGAKFPVTGQLVGEAYFEALVRAFVGDHPPVSPILDLYGDTFAAFLEAFPPLRSLPYLPDVARIEWARCVASIAPDHPVFRIESSADIEVAIETPCQLAPGASLIRSPFPAGTIWERHQAEILAPIPDWTAQTIAVWAQDGRVQQEIIPADFEPVLAGLVNNIPLIALLDATATQEQAVRLIGAFAGFVQSGLLVPNDVNNKNKEHDQ